MPLQANQLLKDNGVKWTNSQAAVSELSDVTLTAPTSNQVLTYNGSSWINSNIANGSGELITNPTTSVIDLNSYNSSIFINYTAPSITVINGPSQIVNPVLVDLVVSLRRCTSVGGICALRGARQHSHY